MNLPINGRIAIIDDQFKQAEPLIQVLSQKQLPHTYFSGEVKFLPNEGDNLNDIRVLFLDINLIDDGEHNNTVLKGRLVPVLNRIISVENYPYVIIYWSRHEEHKNLIEEEIFNDEKVLKHKKPIGYLSATKSDFFNLDGTKTDDFNQQINALFNKINGLIQTFSAYSYLLNWENQVHKATDRTLQDIFSSTHTLPNWSDNANFLINKLGKSFSGNAFDGQKPEQKIKSSYNTLNYVLNDTIEYGINTNGIDNAQELTHLTSNSDTIFTINEKLLFSNQIEPIEYSGTILECKSSKYDSEYEPFLSTSVLKKQNNREKIKDSWNKIWFNVTPLCDTVQGKVVFHRLVRGVIVESKFADSFHQNEAIFITPPFKNDKLNVCIVIDFRHFFCLKSIKLSKNLKPLFRARQQLLAEVQSKLARHISRQGILFLDER